MTMTLAKLLIHTHSIEDKMRDLVNKILEKKYDQASQLFEERIVEIRDKKLHESKKMVAAKISEESFPSALDEEDVEVSRELDELDLSREPKGEVIDKTQEGDKAKSVNDMTNYLNSKKQTVNTSAKTDLPKPNVSVHHKTTPSTIKEDEDEELTEARIKIIKARIRGGKVQRRKKISNVEGYTLRGGKMKRMSPSERRRRKLGQKRGKLKRRSKMRMAMMKRKRSLRKRASIGL
jgi:hypothetical protein